MQQRISLLGIPIDAVSKTDAIALLQNMLSDETCNHVMTPNNEMLVEASRNADFHNVLNRTALNIPDSTGLLFAARWTGQHLPERVTGVDTVERLCRELSSDHPVFLLGAGEGIAQKAAQKLLEQNSNLVVAGIYAGSPSDSEASDIINMINASGAHLLLVAYGAPQQDLWIDRYKDQFTSIRVAMGVGGTFDFLAGEIQRAPLFMRRCGLEWLWRLIRQPSRWRRIFTAVVVFPTLVVLYGKQRK